MGSSERAVRRAAVRLWHAGIFIPGTPSRCASRHWCGRLHHRDVSALAQGTAGVYYGTSGSDTKRDLWAVGDFRASAASAPIWGAFLRALFRLDGIVRGTALRYRNARGWNYSGHHG